MNNTATQTDHLRRIKGKLLVKFRMNLNDEEIFSYIKQLSELHRKDPEEVLVISSMNPDLLGRHIIDINTAGR